jgi:uncharacterized protein
MSEEEKTERGGSTEKSTAARRRILIEALALFGLAILLCSIFWQLRRVSGFINDNVSAFIAAVFLYLPTLLLLRRDEEFDPYGLTLHPLKRGLLTFLLGSLIVFPPFTFGLYLFYRIVCSAATKGFFVPEGLRLQCTTFVGSWYRARLRFPPNFVKMALAQILVVGLPEEWFFRGYLQTRLAEVWPSRRRFWNRSIFVASALFAVGHFLVDFNALRLAVFFPALIFGWMRQTTGSIGASALFHGVCNLVSEVCHKSFFRGG